MPIPSLPRPVLLAAFALSGAAALTYEVVWTRALSVVVGSTTYALSSMLATFMLGLAMGGIAGGASRTVRAACSSGSGGCELGIGTMGIVSHVVIGRCQRSTCRYRPSTCPPAGLLRSCRSGSARSSCSADHPHGNDVPPRDGERRQAWRRWGGSSAGVRREHVRRGRRILVAGFLLIPGLGLRGATIVAAAANLAVGEGRVAGRARGSSLLALAATSARGPRRRGDKPGRLVNFYSAYRYLDGRAVRRRMRRVPRAHRKVFEREGADGHVAAFRDARRPPDPAGRRQDRGHGGGRRREHAAPRVPAGGGRARDPERMLVIGLGAGSPWGRARIVPSVELVEISEGVLEAVRRHGPPGVLDGSRRTGTTRAISSSRADNRGTSSARSRPIRPTSPSRTSSRWSSTSSRPLASRRRVLPVAAVLPAHERRRDDDDEDVRVACSPTLRSGGCGRWTSCCSAAARRSRGAGGDRARPPPRRRLGVRPLAHRSRSPQSLDASDVPVNTDDRPRLEFRVARNLRVGDLATLER